jgi:hypothetical protein
MSEQNSLQTRLNPRKSRQLESPRAFIQRLQAEFPNDTPQQTCERYLSHVREVIDFEEAQDEAYVVGPLTEWLRANVIPPAQRPGPKKQREASTSNVVEQIAKRDGDRIEQIVITSLLEYQTMYGKPLGDCTGAECARLGQQYGGFFSEIATRLTPGQHVRNHITELELQGIASAHHLLPT